jgi:beta-phosphoglucomutase-like phosphatase (HAD superfamily)
MQPDKQVYLFDFDGTLVIFNPMSNEFWKKKNLYKNQRYSSCLN